MSHHDFAVEFSVLSKVSWFAKICIPRNIPNSRTSRYPRILSNDPYGSMGKQKDPSVIGLNND